MDPLEIARWQFGITTVYHFLLVPLTLGLGPVVAIFHTLYVRTGNERYLRMTKFWGKLYLVNFILGVATGIVQEFQFGMAWSEYAKYVGDVFGAPLAMEGLLAFFVESTFLGLWIFGWNRLPKRVHLATIWLAVIGSWLSAYFILVANSWMQHPVGVELVDGRPQLTDIWAVLTNNTALTAFAHTIVGSIAVGGGFLLGISWYHLWRRRHDGIDTVDPVTKHVVVGEAPDVPGRDAQDHSVWLRSLRWGAVLAIIGFGATLFTGDLQGKLMFQQQPMKMAAAEAACHSGTGFSLLTIGDLTAENCNELITLVEVPGLLGFLANSDWNQPVRGIDELIPVYQEQYGAALPDNSLYGERAGRTIDYLPVLPVTYWGFRIMMGFGGIAAFAAAVALWLTRRGTVPNSKWLSRLAVFGILAPFGASAAGWIFTELGRQPFIVAPNPTPGGIDGVFMFTAAAVSPSATFGEVLFSLIALTSIYGVLLVVEVVLLFRYVRGGVPAAMPELVPDDSGPGDQSGPGGADRDDVLAFAY